MRDILLTLFLALAVFFGGTHAYAFTHDHAAAHAGSPLLSHHDGEEESDEEGTADSQSKEVAHSHVVMGAVSDSREAGFQIFKASSVMPIRDVLALPSLGIAPPLEPPSA